MLSRMLIRSAIGMFLAIVLAKPFADWMYLHVESWKFQPTIIVDQPAQTVAPLSQASDIRASTGIGSDAVAKK